MGMTKKDIEIWYRIYLPTGGDTDMRMRPLEYRSFKDWQKALQDKLDEVNFTDFDIVDYSYLTQDEAWQMFHDKVVWEAYDNFFDMAKSNGIPPDVLKSALEDGSLEITEAEEFLENAYEGEFKSMLDFAYYITEEIGLADEQYELYFDYDKFGHDLKMDYSLELLVEEMDYSVSDAEDLLNLKDDDFAEWYIDGLGSISELGDGILTLYFDHKKFARDLEYEGYYEIDGFIFRPY